ncbi:RNA polymerase sigma-70 factor, ECF subfamily [Chitinophaga sp. YR573]|uniref:RNA polymerase sigma factor n=1 Tax=Chitinophaga sp. YR573 TaxID=1881040 RepID=UPI0008BE709D|nr:RNA polymerase sigma-70 factor [Chitinophaga sp. YR573]SEW43329.1 RNA polymerase sigma-70 factor, ECF subfamily [Chitinophaga sp. YR573]
MPGLNTCSDQELLLLLKKGDDTAFTEIYARYWEKMATYAIRLIKSETEGADIVQEIFVSLWNRRETIEVKGTLISYLIKATRNLSLRYIEKNISTNNFLERLSDNMKGISLTIDDQISVKQLQDEIDNAINKLPLKMREIYVLSRYEQLSHKEIAQKLGIAETTVKKQISNAIKVLSSSINSEFLTAFGVIFLHFIKN